MTEIRLGTMGWSYGFWVGPLYPPATPPQDYLTEYAKIFNAVEINSTFFRIPHPSTIRTLSAKIPRKITHVTNLQFNDDLEYFLEVISRLGTKLGPLIFQFPPNFQPDRSRVAELKDFITQLPLKYQFAIEVRHRLVDRNSLQPATRS